MSAGRALRRHSLPRRAVRAMGGRPRLQMGRSAIYPYISYHTTCKNAIGGTVDLPLPAHFLRNLNIFMSTNLCAAHGRFSIPFRFDYSLVAGRYIDLSVTALPCHLPLKGEALDCAKSKAPLVKGSWREAPERSKPIGRAESPAPTETRPQTLFAVWFLRSYSGSGRSTRMGA